MSKLLLYDAIDAQILAEVPEIKIVQLWNNQLVNEGEEARAYPLCYIEFSSIVWFELAKGLAEADITITVRTVIERLQTDDRTFLTIVDNVYKALQLFNDDCFFTPLKRVAERQDTDHDNCIVWETDFITHLVDSTSYSDADKPATTITTLDITTDLDIDDPVIRTGDGDFT